MNKRVVRAKNFQFFSHFSKMPNKRGIITEYLPWLIIGLAVLAILVITIFLLKEKGISTIDSIKGLFKGR